MKSKTIFIILGILVILFFLFRACTLFVKSKVTDTVDKITETDNDFILSDLDFRTKEYAVILNDQEPPVLINDIDALEKNKDIAEADVSWMSYLPGVGKSPKGIYLYKNNTLIEARVARKFKTFEVGTLREYGKPLVYKSIYEPRKSYLKQKDALKKNKNIFIIREAEVNKDGYEYHFQLQCPSIVVAQNDTLFNEYEYGKRFAARIKQSLSKFSNFSMSDNASNSLEPEPLLVLKKNGTTHYLRNGETNNTLSLKGYDLRGAMVVVFCTKEFYEQIQSHDFSSSFIREGLSKEEIHGLIREKIGPDSHEIKATEVFTSLVPTKFTVGQALESKYELRYYELANAD